MQLQCRVLLDNRLRGRVDINRMRVVIVENQTYNEPIEAFEFGESLLAHPKKVEQQGLETLELCHVGHGLVVDRRRAVLARETQGSQLVEFGEMRDAGIADLDEFQRDQLYR